MNPALLPLFVAVPLLVSGLLVVIRHRLVDRVAMVGTPLVSAVAAGALFVHHAAEPVVAHNVGAFVPGVAIPFVSDAASALMLVLTGLMAAAAAWYLTLTGEDRYRFVPPLVVMLIAGVNGALLTGDLFNLFVFVEVMLLPSYVLLAVTGTWRRLGVGRVYILVNLLTSTFLLLGVGFVYAVAGTVNLAVLQGAAAQDPRLGLAIGMVLLALAVKAGVFPVHGWLPSAYPATSAGIMALFSGLHTKVALYAIFRIVATTYGEVVPWVGVLLAVVIATMLVGAVSTAGVGRLRSAIAFQMVSGIGHILIALVVFSAASLGAGLFYLAHHVITVGGLLLLTGAIEQTYGSGRYDRLSGLMRRDRVVAVGFALGLFSLVGLPPTSGLWGKVGLMRAAAEADAGVAAALIGAVILASIASLMALTRLWREVFWGAPMDSYSPDDPEFGRAPRTALPDGVRVPLGLAAPGLALIAVSVALFVFAGVFYPVAADAGVALADATAYAEAVLR
ncbi:monovalent cation/H+ antiporter subunit D family protein [Propioniciclava soli]|uniref:Monovalent cation/H+ antiporter subunit D family protein n=1 Tax=Propioniciclava soli TaxID=2775081 RepID=A0ABZ3CAH3_9ACTN